VCGGWLLLLLFRRRLCVIGRPQPLSVVVAVWRLNPGDRQHESSWKEEALCVWSEGFDQRMHGLEGSGAKLYKTGCNVDRGSVKEEKTRTPAARMNDAPMIIIVTRRNPSWAPLHCIAPGRVGLAS